MNGCRSQTIALIHNPISLQHSLRDFFAAQAFLQDSRLRLLGQSYVRMPPPEFGQPLGLGRGPFWSAASSVLECGDLSPLLPAARKPQSNSGDEDSIPQHYSITRI